jgi:type II secretory pathway component PulM
MTSMTRSLMAGCAMGLVLTLAGCDYWPPALQAQIEQLRAELQKAQSERATLETQLNEATRAKNELQARVAELTRQNNDLASKTAALEQGLAAEREKVAKLTKATAKPAAKAGPKGTTKKPATSTKKTTR